MWIKAAPTACTSSTTGCDDPSGGWSCCSSSNQCNVDEGDCDNDSHCSGNLKCGTNNCDTTQGFPSAYDCCYDPATQGNKAIIPKSISLFLLWHHLLPSTDIFN